LNGNLGRRITRADFSTRRSRRQLPVRLIAVGASVRHDFGKGHGIAARFGTRRPRRNTTRDINGDG
jgi:hypothetical protein